MLLAQTYANHNETITTRVSIVIWGKQTLISYVQTTVMSIPNNTSIDRSASTIDRHHLRTQQQQ